jgi:hypothetical protein
LEEAHEINRAEYATDIGVGYHSEKKTKEAMIKPRIVLLINEIIVINFHGKQRRSLT